MKYMYILFPPSSTQFSTVLLSRWQSSEESSKNLLSKLKNMFAEEKKTILAENALLLQRLCHVPSAAPRPMVCTSCTFSSFDPFFA